jgi:putative tryptophan/tyrosine transport system substrate-binding protein
MRRREFITLLGGTVAAWPFAARAQQAGRLPTIGFLGAATASAWEPWTAAFAQRLRELGWIEDRNLAIEYRWAEGRSERFEEIATEFVRLKVDAVVTGGNAAIAVKRITSVIPIIFVLAVDPVGMGLVASLSHPGGNVTGLSSQQTDTAGKRLELLREVLPDLHRLAIMASVGFPEAEQEARDVQVISKRLGLDVVASEIRRAEDISSAFRTPKGQAEALYVTADAFTNSNRMRINALALAARLPTVYGIEGMVEAGGLMSYGANYSDLFRRAGNYTDKILRGAKPADLPVEQPTKFDLVVNLITAEALGLTVPPSLLARADQVFE